MRRPFNNSTRDARTGTTRAWIATRLPGCFLLKFLLAFAAVGDPSLSAEPNGPKCTLVACGDIMLGGRLHYAKRRHGTPWILGRTAELIGNRDIALGNLECVVAACGDEVPKGENRPYYFRCRPEQLDILTDAGFDIVSCANNHALNYGLAAMREQQELLAAVQIASASYGENRSAAGQPAYIRTGEVVVAVIAFDDQQPSDAADSNHAGIFHLRNATQDSPKLMSAVASARRHADLVVVAPHWGKN